MPCADPRRGTTAMTKTERETAAARRSPGWAALLAPAVGGRGVVAVRHAGPAAGALLERPGQAARRGRWDRALRHQERARPALPRRRSPVGERAGRSDRERSAGDRARGDAGHPERVAPQVQLLGAGHTRIRPPHLRLGERRGDRRRPAGGEGADAVRRTSPTWVPATTPSSSPRRSPEPSHASGSATTSPSTTGIRRSASFASRAPTSARRAAWWGWRAPWPVGAGLLFALSRLVTRRLHVPVWTRRQWKWTVAPVVVVAAGLCVRNLVSTDKVLFGQWSMVSLVLAYLLAAGAWCSWRNLRAERWHELDEATRGRLLEARHAVILFLVIWLVYNSNSARVGMIDCIPAPQMAISLLRQGNMDLDEYLHTYRKSDRRVGLMQANGHWISRWPPGTALFCIPFYALPVALGVEVPSLGVDMLAKLTASTLTAASAVFIFLCLRRFASRRGATWMTIAYALGTASFHISAQDTWTHGPAQFCLAAVLYIVVCEPRRRVVAPAGRALDRPDGRGPPAVGRAGSPPPALDRLSQRHPDRGLVRTWRTATGSFSGRLQHALLRHPGLRRLRGDHRRRLESRRASQGLPRPAHQPQPRHADLLPLPALLHLWRGRRAAAGGTPLPDAGPGAGGRPDRATSSSPRPGEPGTRSCPMAPATRPTPCPTGRYAAGSRSTASEAALSGAACSPPRWSPAS